MAMKENSKNVLNYLKGKNSAAVPVTSADVADALGLEYGTQQGTVRVMEKLLRQEFDNEFLVVQPGEPLTQRMFLNL